MKSDHTKFYVENPDFSLLKMREKIDFVIGILTKVFYKHSSKKLYEIVIAIKNLVIKKTNEEKIFEYIQQISKDLTNMDFLLLCRYFAYHELLTNLVEDIYQTSYENKWEDTYLSNNDFLVNFFNGLKMTNSIFSKLNDVDISIVLTSHPTQVVRETVLRIIKKIMEYLDIETNYYSLFNIHLLDKNQNIEVLIDILWQVSILRDEKTTVENEVKNILTFFDTTFFSILPKINYKFNQLKSNDFEVDIKDNISLKIGSWAGGDRDGNPFVNANSLNDAIFKQVEKLFSFYFFKLESLYNDLLLHDSVTKMDWVILDFIKDVEVKKRAHEQYSIAVLKINTKLFNTSQYLAKNSNLISKLNLINTNEKYDNIDQLLKDLDLILSSLKKNNSYQIAKRNLVDLIYAIKSFGFHLMTIDIRQNSSEHKHTIAQILKASNLCENYEALDETKKEILLFNTINNKFNFDAVDEFTKSEIVVFKTIKEIQTKFGNQAIKNYLISNTTSFIDIFEVIFLFKIINQTDLISLNVVPLFESILDLKNSVNIIKSLITKPYTQKLIKEQWNNSVEVLLGYSDSCKDGGNFCSSWHIYNTQIALINLVKKYGFNISFFHGRGGTIGRGGGPSYLAINSLPNNSVTNKLRFTEQGEIIWAKYANPRKGWFNLESILTATANKVINNSNSSYEDDFFKQTMEELSKISFNKYQSLVYENKDFEQLFFEITPIKEIQNLNIGSRPSLRSNTQTIKQLRSISWVFSWSQIRAMIPGWYGVGTALSQFIEANPNNLNVLRNWYQNVAFFQTMLSNIEMLLAKVNLKISKLYFNFSKNKQCESIYNDIYAEYQKVLKSILLISQKEELLQDYRDLKISLSDRIPYLNVLNYFQLELLHKNKTDSDSYIKNAILISINGIATGLRNSG
ncbi:MAG: phosphoenolpyruvate carboxylase [Malacoplasma sp.]|nr:phosphoenolpyruvate carboxylase [Malacoplasma sp.]